MTNIKNLLYSDIKDLLNTEDIKLYKAAKILFSLFYFYIFLVLIFPYLLRFLDADFIPERKFILAVLLGFLFANIRTVLKLKYIWEDKKAKTIKDLLPIYIINYPITLIAISLIGSYLLLDIWNLSEAVSWFILFCLGFASDSIFYLITHPGDLLLR